MSRDEAELLLDLAAFADGRLDDAARRRIAEFIAHDAEAAGDVVAARALDETALSQADERVITRAAALVDHAGEYGRVISFPLRQSATPQGWRGATAWSSLAAAIALASWLGFDLGSGMSLLRPHSDAAVEDTAANGLLDAPPLVRDFNEGWQT
jgi:anti-sigma factor RsiW